MSVKERRGCAHYHAGEVPARLEAKAVIAGPGITGQAVLHRKYEGRVRMVTRRAGRESPVGSLSENDARTVRSTNHDSGGAGAFVG